MMPRALVVVVAVKAAPSTAAVVAMVVGRHLEARHCLARASVSST